jgi:hypothetical protein
MIGYDNIIKELHFIQHLHTPLKSDVVPEHIVKAMMGLDDMTEYDYESESESESESEATVKDSTKNVVIANNNNNKYVRNEIPDEKRCENILPTGKRCTFKKSNNNNKCSRHSK